jgi:hypothetical protein
LAAALGLVVRADKEVAVYAKEDMKRFEV